MHLVSVLHTVNFNLLLYSQVAKNKHYVYKLNGAVLSFARRNDSLIVCVNNPLSSMSHDTLNT